MTKENPIASELSSQLSRNAKAIVFRDQIRRSVQVVHRQSSIDKRAGNELAALAEQWDSDDSEEFMDETGDGGPSTSNVGSSDDDYVSDDEDEEIIPVTAIKQQLRFLAESFRVDLGHGTMDESIPYVLENQIPISTDFHKIKPLPELPLTAGFEFDALLEEPSESELQSQSDWTDFEKDVYTRFQNQTCVVKTIKNDDWDDFIDRFFTSAPKQIGKYPNKYHDDIPGDQSGLKYNSFVSSTSLLPPLGKKMRAYGSTKSYAVGVVFALPDFQEEQEELQAIADTQTWSWPSGYAAKTEFNVDNHGKLINGREEALASLPTLRTYNQDYITKTDYFIGQKILKGGMETVPYNEVFVRIGGHSRHLMEDQRRSFQQGVGLPVGLFVRSSNVRQLVTLMRTRERLCNIFGLDDMRDLPLLYMTPQDGVRVLTSTLQQRLWKMLVTKITPFQNPLLTHKTKSKMINFENNISKQMTQKLQELINLNHGKAIQDGLTFEERMRLAGGYGATDKSITEVLLDTAKTTDKRLKDIILEGFSYAIRADDDYTAKQLLITYTKISNGIQGKGKHTKRHHNKPESNPKDGADNCADKAPPPPSSPSSSPSTSLSTPPSSPSSTPHEGNADTTSNDTKKHKIRIDEGILFSNEPIMNKQCNIQSVLKNEENKFLHPPPRLHTDNLRNATNSNGILVVLGAAQVLKGLRDQGIYQRTEECYRAVEEWVKLAEESMTFRIESWKKQTAAEHDANVAVENDPKFMAFFGSKAINNRKSFMKQLEKCTTASKGISDGNKQAVPFLYEMYQIVDQMHSPCLRLELLQYILALDTRYSVIHVKKAIHLAINCLVV